MKINTTLSLLFAICLLLSFVSKKTNEDEKHYGIIKTIMGTYEGEFAIKLNEENKGMLVVKVVDEKTKNKGEKRSYKETLSINMFGVRSFETEGVNYLVKNITIEDGKNYTGCCLRITDSCSVASLAYWGTSNDANKCFVITKYNSAYQPLKSIGYFTFSMLFSSCEAIKEKVKQQPKEQKDAYEKFSQEDLLAIWKSRIEEFKNCDK